MTESTPDNFGWVKLHRRSMYSSVFADPNTWMVWTWCLMKATHNVQSFPFNGRDINLRPGQFITGRNKALKELPISAKNYRTAIKYLKTTGRVAIKSTNKFSIITVLNWEKYQSSDEKTASKSANQGPANGQPRATFKNAKNAKNDKNINSASKEAKNPSNPKHISELMQMYRPTNLPPSKNKHPLH